MSIIKVAIDPTGIAEMAAAVYASGKVAKELVSRYHEPTLRGLKRIFEEGVSNGMMRAMEKSSPEVKWYLRIPSTARRAAATAMKHGSYAISPAARWVGEVYDKGYELGLKGKAAGFMRKVEKNGKIKKFVLDDKKILKQLGNVRSHVGRVRAGLRHPALTSLVPGIGGAGIGALSAGKGHRTKGAIIGGSLGYAVPYAGLKYGVTRPDIRAALKHNPEHAFDYIGDIFK